MLLYRAMVARFFIHMIQNEHYRRLYTGGAQTYVDAVRVFNQAYGLCLSPSTILTASLQQESMKRSHDVAHTDEHLLELVRNAELLLRNRWQLRDTVDWSQLIDFISLHDDARSKIPPTPLTLASSQLLEHVFAPLTARRIMAKHWGNIDETLIGIIARHPYHAGHPKRGRGPFSPTEQLAVDIDGLAVLSANRVDVMYAHIKNAFFGASLVPVHGMLSRIFDTHANFSFFFPETREIASSWRSESQMYIKKKFFRS